MTEKFTVIEQKLMELTAKIEIEELKHKNYFKSRNEAPEIIPRWNKEKNDLETLVEYPVLCGDLILESRWNSKQNLKLIQFYEGVSETDEEIGIFTVENENYSFSTFGIYCSTIARIR